MDDIEVVGIDDAETLELTDTDDETRELPDTDTDALPELDTVTEMDGDVLRLCVTVTDELGLRVAL